MKKTLAVLLSCFMLAGIMTGCGNSNTDKKEAAKSTSGATDFSKIKPVTLKLAHIYAPDHPFTKGLEKFCSEVKTMSQGKLTIQQFPAAQLGDEPSIHEGMKNGTVDMAVMGISEAGKDYAPVLVYDAPFIFKDEKQMMAANMSPKGKELWDNFKAKTGFTMLSPIYYGTRQLTTNKKVSNLTDLKGLKIRVPSQQNSVEVWNKLGAVATPMNLGEVYLSLQTGVVDGQENPLATIKSQKFDEVCKFVNLTSHSVQNCPLFIVTKRYEKLDPALKKVLDTCISKYVLPISQDIVDFESKTIEEMAKNGKTTVNKDVDRAAFQKALADYITANDSVWGKGVYDNLSKVTAK